MVFSEVLTLLACFELIMIIFYKSPFGEESECQLPKCYLKANCFAYVYPQKTIVKKFYLQNFHNIQTV